MIQVNEIDDDDALVF